jgi:hypothetical protein
METYKITRLDVAISNDQLASCKNAQELKSYISGSVIPAVFTYLTSQSKGWEVGGSCSSDRGCEVHVGGSVRF